MALGGVPRPQARGHGVAQRFAPHHLHPRFRPTESRILRDRGSAVSEERLYFIVTWLSISRHGPGFDGSEGRSWTYVVRVMSVRRATRSLHLASRESGPRKLGQRRP